MSTVQVHFRSPKDDRCMFIGAESLDPYLAQVLAEDLRRNVRPGVSFDIDVSHGGAPTALRVLADALHDQGLRVRIDGERLHAH